MLNSSGSKMDFGQKFEEAIKKMGSSGYLMRDNWS
jgi:hypothetical protein